MKTYRRIEAVGKAIKIIQFLADQRGPVSGAEVSRAVALPVGTVMCHLVTLEDSRMVRRIGEHWELGDGMAVLWARRKAQLEGGIQQRRNQLKEMGVLDG
jgi:DNA-binding IclR family transcriptional regulator